MPKKPDEIDQILNKTLRQIVGDKLRHFQKIHSANDMLTVMSAAQSVIDTAHAPEGRAESAEKGALHAVIGKRVVAHDGARKEREPRGEQRIEPPRPRIVTDAKGAEERLLAHVLRGQPTPESLAESLADHRLEIRVVPGGERLEGLRIARAGLLEESLHVVAHPTACGW